MSRVLYRPVRGGLDQAMAECREFTSPVEMLTFIRDQYNSYFHKEVTLKEFSIHYYCFDDRINWQTFIICDPEGHPDGWCAFNEDAKKEWKYEKA